PVQDDGHQLLPRPPDPAALGAAGHGDLARAIVRVDAAQRGKRHGILQAAHQPRHRARQPGRNLNLEAALLVGGGMYQLLNWVATIATIGGALMTAANLGTRITGAGFIVFLVGSVSWLSLGLIDGQQALVWTNAVLT